MEESLRDPTVRPERAWRDALTREEIQDLLRTNNWRAWLSIGLDWGLVFGAMAMVAAANWALCSNPRRPLRIFA